MSLSDSLFLFEINIDKFVSYIKCKEFEVFCTFSDIFTLNIKDPRILKKQVLKERMKLTRKSTVKSLTTQRFAKLKFNAAQSILISYNVKRLIAEMKKNPMVLVLRKKSKSAQEFGFAHFEWKKPYIDYLRTLRLNRKSVQTIQTAKECTVFNNVAIAKIASFKITVKLSIVKNLNTNKFNITPLNRSPSLTSFTNNGIESKVMSKGNKITRSRTSIELFIPLKTNEKILTDTTALCIEETQQKTETPFNEIKLSKHKSTINSLMRSATELTKNKDLSVTRSKSISRLEGSKHFNILNYIYGDFNGPYKKQVYYVGYFTVEPDKSKETSISKTGTDQSSEKSSGSKLKSHDINRSNERNANGSTSSSSNSKGVCPFLMPEEVSITQCESIKCDNKTYREVHTPPERQVLLNLDSMQRECCDATGEVEEVVGGVTAKMKFGQDPCFCTCECTFGYTKKTTYCNICGGYEKIGNELAHIPKYELPVPCPLFHKIMDKNKLKTLSTSGSDSRKKDDSLAPKSFKTGSKSSSEKRSNAEKKSGESEKDRIKNQKVKKDNRFKFNYGYKGIPPQIGHSQCVMPCTGSLSPVPKRMGWLWTADNLSGVKFNPQWKPGAIHKFVHRLLKMARNPGSVVAKKKRKDTGKKKRPLKRPLLVVYKKNGEYTVTMETMKNYSKPRHLNQQPYEDKPVLTYTIGRTEEENLARQKKKEREQRRLERAQRLFMQSAFKNMCHEICLKTYQQALGILPDAEDPKCPCYPADPGPDKTNINVSCSCSEETSSLNSDTDSDEWIVEFTPPNAAFDPTFKSKKVFKVDNTTQYTYLDFRLKLLDRYGNPVPRFFKGPDGKQQCSDLGGFWSPDHKWLEINIDGYVAPDERWAPNIFIGPNGESVDAEAGKFQANNGKWLVVGVDGYVDVEGKWRYYSKAKSVLSQKKHPKITEKKVGIKYKKQTNNILTKHVSSWSCFGDVSPLQLSSLGITGHGADRMLLIKKMQQLVRLGQEVKIPQPPTPGFTPLRKRKKLWARNLGISYTRGKCTHSLPSDKGIEAVDAYGNKTYFRLKTHKNKRPKQRMADLFKQGISLSSFHVPCFHSFISSEIMKKQQRERLKALAAKHGYLGA